MTELHQLSATEVVTQVGRRAISPVELVEALIRRIRDLDPGLYAWATLDEEGALTAARTCADSLAAGSPPGLLCGLPTGLKDIYLTAGLRTSANSPLLADF